MNQNLFLCSNKNKELLQESPSNFNDFMFSLKGTIYTLERLKALAKKISFYLSTLAENWILGLSGAVGVGKSTLAQLLLNELCPGQGPFISPTFPLMIPYNNPQRTIWHMDFYRLIPEIPDILDEEIKSCIQYDHCIIEWPEYRNYEKILYPNNTWFLTYDWTQNFYERCITHID
jgi:tRNA threonylcarbamoyl adenosine modification protein YjeE